MTNYIWITAQKEMVHYYPDAPDEVDFLRNIHRHLFKFKVYIEVFHDDRDIEFIMFKREVEEWLEDVKQKLLSKSCENMADYLAKKIKAKYPDRKIKISVSEDGENGAIKSYPKDLNID